MQLAEPNNPSVRGPSEVISRYLEAMYYMTAEGEAVRSARLADWLGVSRPTVTVALRRMARDGMIHVRGRREIELTDAGREVAETIVRRHRIVERWLTDTLGLDWVRADEEAARLEHAVSEEVERRLYEALGRPRTCPHGNPIPGLSEVLPGEVRLSEVGPGSAAVVTRISEVAEREAPLLLTHLLDQRIAPGTRIQVHRVDRAAGTLAVDVGGRPAVIGLDVAGKVWTLPDPPASATP